MVLAGRVSRETMVGFNEEVQGAFMAVPITEGGKTLGVMCVDTVQCHPLLKVRLLCLMEGKTIDHFLLVICSRCGCGNLIEDPSQMICGLHRFGAGRHSQSGSVYTLLPRHRQ